MKIDGNLKQELIGFFESEGGPLHQMWENCDIGRFDDVEWDWAATLDALRDRGIPIPDLGEIGDDPAIRLYRRLMAAEVIQ